LAEPEEEQCLTLPVITDALADALASVLCEPIAGRLPP
jgi:hypothetical protein